jgi:apolipoprotein N-acyltransferase
MRLSPRLPVALGCAASGLALALAVPPWGWWPLAFAGVVGLERLIANRPRRSRLLRAWLTAAFWLYPSMFWMWDLTPPGYMVAPLFYAGMFGLAAAATPPGRGRWLALPGLIVFTEFLRWNWPFGGVPLSTLAMALADSPLAPAARIFGSLLLVALVAVGAVGIVAVLERSWVVAGLCVLLVVSAVAVAPFAPRGHAVDTIEVALVQGGGPQNTRAIDTDEREVFERHLEASELIETPVDLVLWPENVVNVEGPFEDSVEYQELADLARRLDTVVIPGIVEGFRDEGYFLNASVVINPDGEITDRYDKVLRVPFGEYLPFRSIIEPFGPDFLPVREARAGTGEATLDTPVGRMGIVISWEVFFDHRARDAIGNGGKVLLNPTNGSSYWLTMVQSQQIASSRLRALETDRYVLQAAPTGFTAIVEPDGDVIDRTAVSEQAVVQGTIELREGNTLAVRLGSWPMLIIAALAVVAGWLVEQGILRPRRRPERVPPPSDLDEEGDGSVVDQLDGHSGSEAAGSDATPEGP